MSIHKNYLLLTNKERNIVDGIANTAFKHAKQFGLRLDGSDHAERAVEALATWFVVSRVVPKPKPISTRALPKLEQRIKAFVDDNGTKYHKREDGWYWNSGAGWSGPHATAAEAVDAFGDWASDLKWNSQ